MNNLWQWARRLASWLAEAQLLWITLAVIAVAAAVAFRPRAGEAQARFAGLALQLLGVGTAVYSVRETQGFFGKPGPWGLLRQWLSHFPSWKRHLVTGAGAAAFGVTALSARGEVWTPLNPAAPLHDQLNALSKNVDRLRDRVGQLEADLDRHKSDQAEALKRERAAREAGDRDVGGRLEAAQTSGLHVTLVGIAWLLAGLVLTTLSPEIARLRS